MLLSKLIENVDIVNSKNIKDIEISGISFDSRKVKNGDIFVCLKGDKNGNDYAVDAINKGAVCVITEEDLDASVTVIQVQNSRIVLSLISKKFYGSYCDKLKIIMVTGTNGKTSTCYLINSILNFNNYKCGMIGTNGIFYDKKRLYYGLTTPDPVDLHYYFKLLYDMGARYIVMEASAHAIKLYKLYGIKTEQIIFTNLTNEHLDYFISMSEYAKTKIDFVKNKNNKLSIVNIDDDYGLTLCNSDTQTITYGLKNPADTFALDITNSIGGLNFCANVMDSIININSSLIGLYNVYNILASITSAKCLGLNDTQISNGVASLVNIPGRFNKFFLDLNRLIVVDFAHTPDGFKNILSEIKSFRKGKIITLFGCVGYSDKVKRIEMGEIASMYSDKIVLTTDNINFENFDNVCEDILNRVNIPYEKIFDRKLAISNAMCDLKENETLLLLGKGCETSNLINGEKVPHSDIVEVENNIEKFFGVKRGVCRENCIS